MRFTRSLACAAPLMLVASPLLAQEAGHGGSSLMSLKGNLMFWTLAIFLLLFFTLAKLAFKPITAAVDAREKSLEEALASARRDREEAAKLLAEHQARLEAALGEAQKVIADARSAGEKLRADMLDKTRAEQESLLERAQQEIRRERERAVAEMRREAVDLAILGATRVIEENLDTDKNRKLVESFLSAVKPTRNVQ